MQSFEQPGQGLVPGVDPRVGVAGLERAGHVRRNRRLAAEMQPGDSGRRLGGAGVMLGQIVDEHRAARRVLLDDAAHGLALGALIGLNAHVDPVLAQLRATKRDAARLIEGDDEAFGSRAADSPDEASMDLETALARLPAGARTVFALHVEGYSHDEIAQMTGIAAGTARAQLWRARRALAKVLDP